MLMWVSYGLIQEQISRDEESAEKLNMSSVSVFMEKRHRNSLGNGGEQQAWSECGAGRK